MSTLIEQYGLNISAIHRLYNIFEFSHMATTARNEGSVILLFELRVTTTKIPLF